MTRAEILARYPNASESFIRRNATPETVGSLPNTVTQPALRKLTAIQNAGQERSAGNARLRVKITSYRCRLLDADNLCPKFLIDALRYQGKIPDDSPDHIILEVGQEKVATRTEEGTLVEIWLDSNH